jgi:hypothetical protein
MNTQGGVRKVKQLSRADCDEGRSWGVNAYSVWVKNGCRADFESGRGGSSANVGHDWDRGCSDAKNGSYDRSGHASEAYESGWQACKNQHSSSGNVGRDWDRGCSDAKSGSYDRSGHASEAYESGWQACKNQSGSSSSYGSSHSRQATSAAETACMEAVNRNYGGRVHNLHVVKSEFSQANSEVVVSADGERWRCLASNNGNVEDLSRQQ